MPARTTSRFANLDAAADFYGFKPRRFHYLVKLGKKVGEHLPFDHPAEMPGWWERRVDEGALKKKCSQSVLDRAGETVVPLPEKRATPAKKAVKRGPTAKKSPDPAPEPPVLPPPKQADPVPAAHPVTMFTGQAMSHGELVASDQRMFQTFDAMYREEIMTNGVTTPLATRLFNQRQAFQGNVERLMRSGKHFRDEKDWMRRDEVVATASEFAQAIKLIIWSEIPRHFPRESQGVVRKALDAAAARIQTDLAASVTP